MKHTHSLITAFLLAELTTPCLSRAEIGGGWKQSFKAETEAIGGTEIVHLAAHKGRLYAGIGYWMDPRAPDIPWARVLVLDAPGGRWKVDLELGAKHLRVTALKSVTFTTDGDGKELASPVNLLMAASDSQGESHIWTRDDDRNTWAKTTLQGDPKYRRSTRALIVHRDQKTGVDRIFVAAGALGLYSGVYDAGEPGRIRWDGKAELGPVTIRPMSFAEANGRLYASVGVSVYRRADGSEPVWEKVYSDNTPEHWELGGIRGLTAVPAPDGFGESLLFSHTDRIIRLDTGSDNKATVELEIKPLLQKSWGTAVRGGVIAAYSDMLPLKDPATGRTVHIIGVEGRIEQGGRDKQYRPDTYGGWHASGSYLIRDSDQRYRLKEVNDRWSPGKPKLVAPRAYAVSPFPGDAGRYVYFGGFDCNFFPARDTAWIFRASIDTVLGVAPCKAYRANPKPPTDGLVGANYTPAYAVNQVQFWHDFRPEVVEKELAAAREYFGISTLRVFLHNINFDEEKTVFLSNVEKFLTICERNGIRPGFVFFDDCHRDEGIFLDKPTEPIAGWHNGRWAQCPQKRDRDAEHLEKFKPYVQEVIRAHRTDRRVLFWEIFNEPAPGAAYSDRLKRAGYQWAKDVEPTQPVLNCEKGTQGWGDSEVTDIVDAHIYSNAHGPLRTLADANPKKGTVITEAGARWKATRKDHGDPCGIIDWLEKRRADGNSTPGVYLCWELMVGNSNCRWHWIDKPGAPEPEIPWCGLLWPDATPVSLAEAEAIRSYATGKSQALLYSDFEHSSQGWHPYGVKEVKAVNALSLPPDAKAIAGDVKWTDYILEGRVAMQSAKDTAMSANAGLIFRVNHPGEALDQMRGYAVTYDRENLVLSKFNNGSRQTLATWKLTTLKNKTRIDEWNLLRIAASGPRIRVWFNRLHPTADADQGLRIDYTDTSDPILAGAIGVVAINTAALFDNIVVMPADPRPPSPPAASISPANVHQQENLGSETTHD